MKGHLALITGATSGIGLATAKQLAAQGCDLILTGRRLNRLEKTANEISHAHGVKVLIAAFDISSREDTEAACAKLAGELPRLTILVNNAGLAIGTASVQTTDLSHVDRMIDTNVKGLLYITRLCLPHLIKTGGHVLNIGSVAGRWVYPGGAVYAATKFAVRAITEALRMDLMGTSVRVTNIAPGMVETEFSEVRYSGDTDKAAAVYKGMKPLSADDVAESIVWCLMRPKHVNVQELIIYPTAQAGVGPYITRD